MRASLMGEGLIWGAYLKHQNLPTIAIYVMDFHPLHAALCDPIGSISQKRVCDMALHSFYMLFALAHP